MSVLSGSIGVTVAVITAMGALGTSAFGLVDALKAFGGGVSNIGFSRIVAALSSFEPALSNATPQWKASLRANWINGVAKDDQKIAAKNLIRLGLSSANASQLAAAGHVDPNQLQLAMQAIESGNALTTEEAQLFGRFNAVVDAIMDAAFERGDQQYRNASKFAAAVIAVLLSVWAGYLLNGTHGMPLASAGDFWGSQIFGWSLLVGCLAVPIAPIAKDLASSLQVAANAVSSFKS